MKFSELSSKNRRLVLTWMVDGLNAGVQKQIARSAYMELCSSLRDNRQFDIERAFFGLPSRSMEHIDHIGEAMNILESALQGVSNDSES